MNVSLPAPLKAFVDEQLAAGRYSTASEYIRELIREDERRKAEERVESLLLEGLESPKSALTRGDFARVRRDALARLKARRR